MATYDLKYPGAAIDAILDTAYDLQNAGYIFRGLASEYSNTPTERSWVLAGEGETGHGFTSPIPKGYIGVCVFNGTFWTGKLVKCVSIDSAPTPSSTNAVSSGGAYAALNQLATGVAEALDNMQFTDVTPPADQYDQLKLKLATTDSGIERIITYLTILSATASKAGLLSAADKAKLDALWSSGYQFAGIATPSTTPISTTSKIFYIATEAGTYFNTVTITKGINILSWDGSAWSAVQVIGIDNVPTAGSDNLVKSGGVFGELALGAVYDVSAKNPTAGPNSDGKWESLSALLSDANLNTLIPTSVRKGGMSIKYVQSSDNKYVQARCMAQTFTTDVTQWQGIDDEPTVGSDNLVKSSGVYSVINQYEDIHTLIGNDMNYVKLQIKNIYAKRIAVLFESPNWSVPKQSDSSYTRFQLFNSAETPVYSITINQILSDTDNPIIYEYSEIQKDIYIGGRASKGTSVNVRIINLDKATVYPENYFPKLSLAERYAYKQFSETLDIDDKYLSTILNPENIESSSVETGRLVNGVVRNSSSGDNAFETFTYEITKPGIYFIHGWTHGNAGMYDSCCLSYNDRVFSGFNSGSVGEFKRVVKIPFTCTLRIVDKASTENPIGCEVVKVNDSDYIEIISNGGNYTETIGRKIYAGRKYQIGLYTTDWDFGTTESAATIFQYGYYNSDNQKVIVKNVAYSERTNLKKSYLLEVPNDINGARLYIGGRCLSKTKVRFTIDELFYNEDESFNANNYGNLTYSDIDKAKLRGMTLLSFDTITDYYKYYKSNDIEPSGTEVGRLIGYGVRSNTRWGDDGFNTYSYNVDAGIYLIRAWRSGETNAKSVLVLKDGEPYMDFVCGKDNNRTGIQVFAIKVPLDGSVIKITDTVSDPTNHSVTKLLEKVSFKSLQINTYNSVKLFGLKPGNYRLLVKNPDWKRTEAQAGFILRVQYGETSSSTLTEVVSVYKASPSSENPTVKDSYDFSLPYGSNYLEIGGRTNLNEVANFELINLNNYNETIPSEAEGYEVFGVNYPEQTVKIATLSEQVNYTPYDGNIERFHFLHISDNHNGNFGRAEEFVDLCPAQFLVNTGDMVFDKLADATSGDYAFHTITCMNRAQKPVYLVLGNHDYCVYASDGLTQQDVFDTFIAPMNTHNGTSFDKSYYNVDFAEHKIKCIMLDMNDGWGADLVGQGPTNLTYSCKMSGEQINWFISQLQDAKTNGYHVCLFIHKVPVHLYGGNYISKFADDYDNNGYSYSTNFLLNIVQAFIDGTSGSVTHEGNTYNFSFNGAGNFVAWFAGHTHYDLCGYAPSYPKQLIVHVPQPFLGSFSLDGTSTLKRKMGIHYNYVTVDIKRRKVTILRIGDTASKYGDNKDSFSVFY